MKKTLLLTLLALILAGCCSYEITHEGDRTMCYVENNGWKLFGCIPIASGDPEMPNRNQAIWGIDSLTLEVNMMVLDAAIRKERAKSTKNLVSYMDEEPIIPFFVKRYMYYTSAELVK